MIERDKDNLVKKMNNPTNSELNSIGFTHIMTTFDARFLLLYQPVPKYGYAVYVMIAADDTRTLLPLADHYVKELPLSAGLWPII